MEIMLLKSHLDDLVTSLEDLSDLIANTPDIFIAREAGPFATGDQAIGLAQHSIKDLYYDDQNPDGRFTSVCLGAIAVDPDWIKTAVEVNRMKDEFHKACRTLMDSARGRGGQTLSPQAKAKRLRAVITEAGYPRLSLRQCFRHIPVVNFTPISIGFTFSSGGRSIKRISVQEAVELLEKATFESDKSSVDHRLLSGLPANTPLAQVQDLPGYYKANVLYEPGGQVETIPTFMPILYPYDPECPLKRQEKLPDADLQKRLTRKVRSDKKLQDEPLVASIRVFAYKV